MSRSERFVLDTNVLAALRVRGRNPDVAGWAESVSISDQFVTSVMIAEVERGVVAKEGSDPPQGTVLRSWFEDHFLPAFEGRVLPFDLRAARILADDRVLELAPFDDALIAAIAQASEMTVVTRNVRHFEPLGVSIRNPWND